MGSYIAEMVHEEIKLLERRPADIPPAVVDAMNREIRQEREGIRQGEEPVPECRRRRLDDVESRDGAPLVVAQECEGGAEPGAERRGDLGRVRRDHRELAVVDGEFVLELGQVPQLAPALRSPVPTVEAHDERELACER